MNSSARTFLALLAVCAFAGCAGTLAPSRHNALDYTALDAAIEGGDLATVKYFVGKEPRLVNGKGWGDTAPLHLAALNDQTEIAVFLIQNKADVNARADEGETALHIAAQRNNRDLVELLLLHRADINALDSKQRTPADRAKQWHHPELATFLRRKAS
jgi:ankyrin repeat protein